MAGAEPWPEGTNSMSQHTTPRKIHFAGAAAAVLLAGTAPVAGWDRGSTGADVIVGDVGSDIVRWGEVGGITAYSLSTDSCNEGDEPLPWIAVTNQHPVIAQNMYRLKDGRFEQIGMSWLKHGFAALALDLCSGDCLDPIDPALLGVGCSDPYSALLNGDQEGFEMVGGLGPRFEVDAATGDFSFPYTDQGLGGDAIYKRLQVHNDDLDAGLNPGALYFIEGQYITAADALAGNDDNNASYRQVEVDGELDLDAVAPTVREQAAILAWPAADPSVGVNFIDVAGDGRFILANRARHTPEGRWLYEYALYNMNSHRSAGAFTVPMNPDTVVDATGFHDVDYHSGEPFDGTDWPATVGADTVSWATTDFATDPNANALRWGTLYNFRLDASHPPGPANIEIGLFRPGLPEQLMVAAVGPTGQIDIFADGFESGDTLSWSSTTTP